MKSRTMVLLVLAGVALLGLHAAFALFTMDVLPTPPAAVKNFGGAVLNAPAEVFGGGPVAAPAEPRAPEQLQEERGPAVPVSEYAVTGPFTHGNLSVFLIHGPDTVKGQPILTLQAALEQNQVTVREGAIAINNRAGVPVFIQAGDIIKGGNQDRVLPYDYLVPTGTSNLPLNVFCVEAGRSFPRGQELSTAFHSATEQLPGKRLHLAARYKHSQGEVWAGVQQIQAALAKNVGGTVQSPQSRSSLQLTLENDRLRNALQNTFETLAPLPAGKEGVIGTAVAINGQLQSAEIYGSSSLFLDLWPKLIRASAVAALAEQQPAPDLPVPTLEAARKFLADAAAGTECSRTKNHGTLVLRQESAGLLLFDTCDPAHQNLVLHRSILAK
jgi:hypothetical protein